MAFTVLLPLSIASILWWPEIGIGERFPSYISTAFNHLVLFAWKFVMVIYACHVYRVLKLSEETSRA